MLVYEWFFFRKDIIKGTYRRIVDGIDYIKGSKEERNFIKKVPRYCRWECRYVYICRIEEKDWKCKRGCIKLNGFDPKIHHL